MRTGKFIYSMFCTLLLLASPGWLQAQSGPYTLSSASGCTAAPLQLSGVPAPRSVQWYRDNNPVHSSPLEWGPASFELPDLELNTGTGMGYISSFAMDKDGNFYFCETNEARVQKWAPGATSGTIVAGGNGTGSGPDQLAYPAGIFVDDTGNIYIADVNNYRIQKWTPGATEGITVAGGTFGDGPGDIKTAYSVYVDTAGNIYVLDVSNARVQMWASGAATGITVAGGNGIGTDLNQLYANSGSIVVDAAGNIYITEPELDQVKKWEPGASSGTIVAGGNGRGFDPGQLFSPTAIAIDKEGTLYVSSEKRIYSWVPGAPEGTWIFGQASEPLGNIVGIIVNSQGVVYTSDYLDQGSGPIARTRKFSPVLPAYTPSDAGSYMAVITDFDGGTTSSNAVDVGQTVSMTVQISVGSGGIHPGTPFELFASTQHDGGSPAFEWKSNGVLLGTSSALPVASPVEGQVYALTVTGSGACLTNPVVTRYFATHTPPVVSISGNPCIGIPVTVTTDHPLSAVSWLLNGSPLRHDYPDWGAESIIAAGGNGTGDASNQLWFSGRLALDDTGNLYVLDLNYNNYRVQKWTPGATEGVTVAGGMGVGSDPEQLNNPADMCLDNLGNIYIADRDNHRIQKWIPGATEGITVAGGNGGGNASNQLFFPDGIAIDLDGNLYIADMLNARIQKWTPGADTGITIAGGNGAGSDLNQFSFPATIRRDALGALYIADKNNARIVKWTEGATAGEIVAGGNGSGTADNQLDAPEQFDIDGSGHIYTPDNNESVIRMWSYGTTTSVKVAGGSQAANPLNYPGSVLVTSGGVMYVGDASAVREFNLQGTFSYMPDSDGYYQVQALGFSGGSAVSDSVYFTAVRTPAVTVQVDPSAVFDSGVAVTYMADPQYGGTAPIYQWSKNGVIVGTDSVNYTDLAPSDGDQIMCTLTSNYPCVFPATVSSSVRSLSFNPKGALVSDGLCVVSHLGYQAASATSQVEWKRNDSLLQISYNTWDSTGQVAVPGEEPSAEFSGYYGFCMDNAGNSYISDVINGVVKKWAPGADTGVTVAGGNGSGSGSNQLESPSAICLDVEGNLYIADNGNMRIQKWAPGADTGITVVDLSSEGMTASYGIFVDRNRNIYISDIGNGFVTKWAADGSFLDLVAGHPGSSGSDPDELSYPAGIFVDDNDNLYVADMQNSRVQKFMPGNPYAITVAGGNGPGIDSDQVGVPFSVFVDGASNVYVTDALDYSVARWAPGDTAGTRIKKGADTLSNSFFTGAFLMSTFDRRGNLYTMYGYDHAVNKYQVLDTFNYTAEASGLYTATSIGFNGAEKVDSVTINDNVSASVSIIASATFIQPGSNVSFTATPVNGGPAPVYHWKVNGADQGTDSPDFSSSSLAEGDSITCELSSSAVCLSGPPVVGSNSILIHSFSFTGSNCLNDSLILTSGSAVKQVQWFRNDTLIQTAEQAWSENGSVVLSHESGRFDYMHMDKTGNIYVSDLSSGNILKFLPGADTGIVVVSGLPLDDNVFPRTVCVDDTGNVYVSEFYGNVVRKYAPGATSGITVAGGNGIGSAANQLSFPTRMTLDDSGNLYIVDAGNYRIQKWAPGAAEGETIGGGTEGTGADQLSDIGNIFVDNHTGAVYVADYGNSRVQKYTYGSTSGVTVAGGNGQGNGDNQLKFPADVFVDDAQNVFVADAGNLRIQLWDSGAVTGRTIAGGNGYGTDANQLIGPRFLALRNSEIYVLQISTEPTENSVKKFSITDKYRFEPAVPGVYKAVITTVSGDTGTTHTIAVIPKITPTITVSSDAPAMVQQGTTVNFTAHPVDAGPNPVFIWVKNSSAYFNLDSVYTDNALADGDQVACYVTGSYPCGNYTSLLSNVIAIHVVDAVSLNGNQCTGSTLAGASTGPFVKSEWLLDGNPISSKTQWVTPATTVAGMNPAGGAAPDELSSPNQLAVDAAGNIYISDEQNHRVQKWTPGAASGVTVAGGNGQGSNADQLDSPEGIFVDASGNLFVADKLNNRIQEWTPDATTGITVAGGNGPGNNPNQLSSPQDISVDPSGAMFIVNRGDNSIWKWQLGDSTGTRILGSPWAGGSGPDEFNGPMSVTLDDSGNIYVGDLGNHRVQKFAPGATSGVTVAGGNGAGNDPSQIYWPAELMVDKGGNLYIADINAQKISFWSPGASYGIDIAPYTTGPIINYFAPGGVAMDSHGTIYVSDPVYNKVMKFLPRSTDSVIADDAGIYTFRVTDFKGNVVNSNTINVYTQHYPSVTIVADPGNTIIPGQPVSFTAVPADAGASPSYEWYRNGFNTGVTDNVYTSNSFEDNELIEVRVTSNDFCTSAPVVKALVGMHADPVAILSGDSCQGSALTLSNDLPLSQVVWKNNGNIVQTVNALWETSASASISSIDTTGGGWFPRSLSVDKAGNLYLVEPANNRVQKFAPGDMTGVTVAGMAPDELIRPGSIYVDSSGNIYVSDDGNSRIQKYPADGSSPITVAGGNGNGSLPDQLEDYIGAIFVDAGENIYVLDNKNHRIQKFAPDDPNGVTVLTIQDYIESMYMDKSNNIYLTDASNNQVLRYIPGDTTGSVVAGGNGNGSTLSQLRSPTYTYVDDAGYIYISDAGNHRVQLWVPGASEGITVAGGNGYGSDPGQLAYPTGLTLDSQRNLYVVDADNYRLQRFDLPDVSHFTTNAGGDYTAEVTTLGGVQKETAIHNVISTRYPFVSIAGESNIVPGQPASFTSSSSDGGSSPVYQWKKNGIDVGSNADTYTDSNPAEGDIYNCDMVSNLFCVVPGPVSSNFMIVHNAPDVAISGSECPGSILSVTSNLKPSEVSWEVNGSGFETKQAVWDAAGTVVAGDNGQGNAADQLNSPIGIARDDSGNIYVADFYNARVQKWALGADTGITVAGGNGSGNGANQLANPSGVYVDHSGNIYVADKSNHRVQKWEPGATSGETVAGGNGQGNAPNQLNYPHDLGMDAAGNLYISDWFNHRVQKWASGATEGVTAATGSPLGIFVQPDGTLYVADEDQHRIQKWTPGASSGAIVAGGYGPGSDELSLRYPSDVAVDGLGNMYVTDAANGRIQRFTVNASVGATIAGGSASNPPNQFANAQSIAVDNNGTIYVCDQPRHRVIKYDAGGDFSLQAQVSGSHRALVKSFNGGHAYSDTINILQVITPDVNVVSSVDNICFGMPVSFTASQTGGGTIPSYQWTKNGLPVGSNSDTYVDSALNDQDTVLCRVTSDAVCGPVGVSNSVVMNVSVPPTIQANLLTFPSITDSSIRMRFKRGNGQAGIVVLVREASPIAFDPECGRSYDAPSDTTADFSVAGPYPTIGAAKVIFRSTTPTTGYINLNVTGLKSGARYYFALYEYDSTASGIAYLSPGLKADKITSSLAPAVAASNIRFENLTSSSFQVGWTNGDGDGRLVIVKEIKSVNANPVDGKNYYANPYLGNGDSVATPAIYTGTQYAVYDGTDSFTTVLNLHPETKYYVSVVEYKKPEGYPNYIATALKGSTVTTLDYIPLTLAGVPYSPEFDTFNLKVPAGWNDMGSALPVNNGENHFPGMYVFQGSSKSYLGKIGGGIYGVKLRNKSKVPFTSVLVNYTAKQWYTTVTDHASDDSLYVEYSTDATSVNSPGNWTRLSGVTVKTLQLDTSSDGSGTIWGNDGESALLQASVTGLNLVPGDAILIRFKSDFPEPGHNDALVITDLNIVPFSNTFTSDGQLPAGVYNDLNVAGGTLTLDNNVNISKAVNIERNAVLDIHGQRLILRSELYGYGQIAGSSTSALGLYGTSKNYVPYFKPGSNTLFQFFLRGGSVASLRGPLAIAASPKPGSVRLGHPLRGNGKLESSGNLILKSDSLGTAAISSIYGSVDGDIIVERWMQTDSSIRLLSHPFSTPVELSQLNDDIPVDVSGSLTQNLWYYNPLLANPASITSLVSDAAWAAYGNSSDHWNPAQVIRLLKPRGMAVADISGVANQGNIDLTVSGTVTDSFVIIGNPYPAGLRLGAALNAATASGGNMKSAAIWSWEPTLGNAGAFRVIPNSKFQTTKLPICGAFVAMVDPGTSAVLNFTESDKTVTGNTRLYFRADGEEDEEDLPMEEPAITLNEGLQLSVEKEGKTFDETYVFFNAGAQTAREVLDAPKLVNPGFNLYSLSSGDDKLSVDVRPFETGKIIDLGLATKERGTFKFTAEDFNLPAGTELYLVDKYLGREKLLDAMTTYSFNIDDNTASQGSRFYLRMGRSAIPATASGLQLDMMPNPAKDHVNLHISAPEDGKGIVRLLTAAGQQLNAVDLESVQNATITIPLRDLASGIYLVEFTSGGNKITKRLIKQ